MVSQEHATLSVIFQITPGTFDFFALINFLKFITGSILVKVAPSIQAYLQLSGKEVNVNSEVHVQEMTEVHKEDGVIITGKGAAFCYVR